MAINQEQQKGKLGLLGRNIAYSFSRKHFSEKFERENLPFTYVNFDLQYIEEFPDLVKNTPNLKGMNVTIPYKEVVMPYLDDLSDIAKSIGAVNTITVSEDKKLTGHNTDYYGFQKSIVPFIEVQHKRALILGTGGAAKAVAYVLKTLGIEYGYVSRNLREGIAFSYDTLNAEIIEDHKVIVNCTPLGTHPNIELYPDIPYEGVGPQHLLFDLIYNPATTQFLQLGEKRGATICNGSRMLELQAQEAWRIWDLV